VDDGSLGCSDTSYTIFDADDCAEAAGKSVELTMPGACMDVSDLLDGKSGSVRAHLPVATGSCTPSGGIGLGTVVPQGPVTLCCQ